MTNTITLVKPLIAKSGDPKAKAHYNDCLENFDYEDGAIGDIDDTQQDLKKGDYASMSFAASAFLHKVDDCISGENLGERFPDPSPLPKYGGVMEDVISIILVISNKLRGA
ncbi:uncharacterized protein LOC130736526 [Lotus japonicus]|uniref:uncharacterized protein LOC130736526 n=1 Tax=Lotus japonicus TaxID=34305 RepID=UPI00258FBDBE|nr:uncharacterized protein LOC130736526 [Lotus japonicus]